MTALVLVFSVEITVLALAVSMQPQILIHVLLFCHLVELLLGQFHLLSWTLVLHLV